MYDTETLQPTDEVIAAIEWLRPPLHGPNYDTPEGVLFRKAMGLIEDESRWAPFCSVGQKNCSIGAMVYMGGDYDLRCVLIDGLQTAIGNKQSVPAFNDTHTHAEVMAKWRECGIANGWL